LLIFWEVIFIFGGSIFPMTGWLGWMCRLVGKTKAWLLALIQLRSEVDVPTSRTLWIGPRPVWQLRYRPTSPSVLSCFCHSFITHCKATSRKP
jgi:hypothetical protein